MPEDTYSESLLTTRAFPFGKGYGELPFVPRFLLSRVQKRELIFYPVSGNLMQIYLEVSYGMQKQMRVVEDGNHKDGGNEENGCKEEVISLLRVQASVWTRSLKETV
ncbi:MAG: hypothetical protein U0411_09860 [Thermodesulfovibrionales bacterium]